MGFENHSGRTYIGKLNPLGKVIEGYGNNGEDGYEVCYIKTHTAHTFWLFFPKTQNLQTDLLKLLFQINMEVWSLLL